ncbi:hypothetical protein LKL35_26315 [Streptomyces sp. ET3-23]|uniref:hypothetical protein n=1 Tax=Streptomyces sp. ET3-23 TaxID=2885643 RepID=UPI001D12B157|nr:hypothetical protein [Streptomyces sp. ET3-23]MCC2278915.1 hypothetical protein [Streptomyces sp. ET3-23]
MSAMTCRECDLGPYAAQPDGLFHCTECGHRLAIGDLCLTADEVWSVDETGTLQHYLTPAACLKWMEEIADFPRGDWEKAQHALWHYRRATAELLDALRAGLPLPA